MVNKAKKKIPANSISYIMICGGIVLLVVLLGIIPLQTYKSRRAQSVLKIQNQIDEQKELGQVYKVVQKLSEKKVVHALPNPIKVKIAGQDAVKFENSFRFEAGKRDWQPFP